MKDDLGKKMEDDLKKNGNGRRSMHIRGKGGDYRDGPLVADKDANWDMMHFVKVI